MTKPTATLITGGSNGIGEAIVNARIEMGDAVLNMDREVPKNSSNAEFINVDLTANSALQETLNELTARYTITRVVNCAGVALLSLIEDFNEDDFRKTMELNVLAPAIIVKAVIPGMRELGFGRIVNIASRAALGKEFRTSYAGSKGALISATRVWALELGKYGITVNAIGPGPVETELFKHANPPGSERTKKLIENIPVGRIGQPSDIAAAADYFLSDQAGYVTGQALYVCGGMSVGDAGN
jgi:NAD(P)-dependent dehydrogenase (short-subunit alcohol dehydrogenase family)